MKDLCRKILLVAQIFPRSIAAPGELAAVLWTAVEAKILQDGGRSARRDGGVISDALWIMASLETTGTQPQAREHLDVDSTFVSFCSESLEAATSENPSSSVEERRNCIRHILSYLRQYIETSGYKYRDAYLFLRDMEDLCKKILLAAQTLPGSIAAPDELAAMFRTAIEAKLDDDDDLNFVMRHNKRTVLDYLSTIEALVTTQPRVSGSQGGAQVDWTGPSPSSLLREEAVVRSETHKEPSNLTGTSSQQLHQFIVEGEFGGEEEQTASWSSSL
ncbi:hypothetical protein A0H81_13052 [Grifola frondosa]|uniref:Uncharacterized protein n=1 Tax=Grifola frondosa TaxID=5627 RepID=A0A1C7LQP3_GRIFR|nr:hypothetical protein A0H81_13052 [Grifola frondosa]